jgi:TPR repeat protein
MKTIHKLIYLFSVFVMILLLLDTYGRDILVASGSQSGSERLSIWERYQLINKVESGDILAAKLLAGHYGIWEQDYEKMMHWTLKSAELGDPADQYNYGIYLVKKKKNLVEGAKWINKSAALGDKDAINYLQTNKQ